MKNFDIYQIEQTFKRLSEKADLCHRLGAIADYRCERFFENAGSFTFKVSINVTGYQERQEWEAYRHLYGSDHEYHINISQAEALDKAMEEIVAGVMKDIRDKKEIIEAYYNPIQFI